MKNSSSASPRSTPIPTMFHREMLYLSRDRFEILRSELWELTQAFLDARRRGVFYQNTAFCFNYQRPCAYFALCRSNGNPNVIENFYQRVPPNEELRVLPNESTGTSFLKKETNAIMSILPTAKTPPKPSLADLTVLVYGQTKIGKSTLCAQCRRRPVPGHRARLERARCFPGAHPVLGRSAERLRRDRRQASTRSRRSSSTPSTTPTSSAPTTSSRSTRSSTSPISATARATRSSTTNSSAC